MAPEWSRLKAAATHLKLEGKLSEAIETLIEALDVALKDAPKEVALIHNILADLYLKSGNLEAAEQAAQKSIRYETVFGEGRLGAERLATYYVMMSRVSEASHRPREALEHLQKAVTGFIPLYGPDNTFVQELQIHAQRLEAVVRRG